jgi:hypothetical protein
MFHWLQDNHEAHGPYGVEMPTDWSLIVSTVTEVKVEQRKHQVVEKSEECRDGTLGKRV